MSGWKPRIATAVAMILWLLGIVLIAFAIPQSTGSGWVLILGDATAVPTWTSVVSFVGGPLVTLFASAVGMRYGNFERYHSDYNPETGLIEGHWLGRFQRLVSKPPQSTTFSANNPPKFVLRRAHLAVACFLPTITVATYVLILDWNFIIWLPWLIAGTLLLLSTGVFILLDWILRSRDDMDYEVA